MDCLYIKKNIKGKKCDSPFTLNLDGGYNFEYDMLRIEEDMSRIQRDENRAVAADEPQNDNNIVAGGGLLTQLQVQEEPREAQPLSWREISDMIQQYNDNYRNVVNQGANQYYAWYQI